MDQQSNYNGAQERRVPTAGLVMLVVYETYTTRYGGGMSVPITTRLDEGTVAALDDAVRAGAGTTRAAVVADAVREWLARHSEDAIVESYHRAYAEGDAEADAEHDALIARLGAHSARVMVEDGPVIARGDLCVADIPGVGRHPVVVVTRDSAIAVLTSVVCVLITTRVRGHVAEVQVGRDEGLREEGAANCDNVFTLPKAVLRRVGRLGPAKLHELDGALAVALGLR